MSPKNDHQQAWPGAMGMSNPMLLPGQVTAPETQQKSLWAIVDDRLRGRWLWMILVGALLAGGLAAYGWRSTVPLFQSEAAIRIAPRLPHTLTEIDEVGNMPHYTTFVQTQVQLLQGRRVLEHALKQESLSGTPFAGSPNAIIALEKGVEAAADRNTQLMWVMYASDSKALAQQVVAAVVKAYIDIHGSMDSGELGQKMNRLRTLEGTLSREMRTTTEEINKIYVRHGTNDLVDLQRRKLEKIEEAQTILAQAELALRRLESNGAGTEESEVPTFAKLEEFDERLAELRHIRDRAETEFESVKLRYHKSAPVYVNAETQFLTASQLYDDHARYLMDNWDQVVQEASLATLETVVQAMTPEHLREEIELRTDQIAQLRQESQEIINDAQVLSGLQSDEERTERELNEAIARRKQLEIEEPIITLGRISVVQDATMPTSVYSDGRRKRAAMGGLAGFALSFGAFFLLGTLDRRAYQSHQISNQGELGVKCLGVLPELGRTFGDESHDVASHCVHQIRNQIEATRDARDGYVISVTSPFQGDGKTSVVMALGWSYAVAGYDTVVVDCDLVARSLTRQLGMIGRDGLKEVLASQRLNGEVAPLPMPHLTVLPAGADPHFGPEAIRRGDLVRTFEELRRRFDVVLVDTGPLLGSLESTPVVSASDGVVLLVRRGRSRGRLEDCVNRLKSVGGNCLGVILNHAVRSDCQRYVSDASLAEVEVERVEQASDTSVVRAAEGERNVLMLAMESTSRPRRHEDDGEPA